MSFTDPASPKETAAADAGQSASQSETEKLCDQAYRQLQSVAGAQTSVQAIEGCQLAIEIFRQAQEAAGDDTEQRHFARQGLASAYSQLGHQQRYTNNHPAAITNLTESLKLNPTLFDDYFYRAQSYLKTGDTQAARKDFTQYLRWGEDEYLRFVADEQNAALVLKAEDGATRAAHWQQEGMRLNAEAATLMHPRGDARPEPARAVALFNKALDALAKALEAKPKDVMTQIALISALSEQANCYLEMSEYDLAIDNYNRAYNIRPLAQYIFKRGEAYRAGGHIEPARADFERYLKEGNEQALKQQAKQYLEEKPKKAVPEDGA